MTKNILTLIFIVFFATSCSAKIKVKAAKAALTLVETTITTTSSGTIEAEQQAALGFSIVGRISKVNVHLGDRVKTGQVLAEIDNEELKATYNDSANEYSRAQELFKEGLVSKVALDDAKRNLEISRATLSKAQIKAPFEGIITQQNLEVGELFQLTSVTGKSPLYIVDLKPRMVKGNVDEIDLAKIKKGMVARIKVPAAGNRKFNAVIERVVPFISTLKEQDRTSQIELKITDPSESIPVGASADVEIITDSKENALAIPANTVLGRGENRYVFLVDGSRVKKQIIKTGVGNYSRLEVVSGINLGETIAYPPDSAELKDGSKVDPELISWP